MKRLLPLIFVLCLALSVFAAMPPPGFLDFSGEFVYNLSGDSVAVTDGGADTVWISATTIRNAILDFGLATPLDPIRWDSILTEIRTAQLALADTNLYTQTTLLSGDTAIGDTAADLRAEFPQIKIDTVGGGTGVIVVDTPIFQPGTNISFSLDGDSITISATGGGSGEANTMSSVGGGFEITLPKSGVNLPIKTFTGGNGIAIDSETVNILNFEVDTTIISTVGHAENYADTTIGDSLNPYFDSVQTKFYADSVAEKAAADSLALAVLKTGSTMSGDLAMGDNDISGVNKITADTVSAPTLIGPVGETPSIDFGGPVLDIFDSTKYDSILNDIRNPTGSVWGVGSAPGDTSVSYVVNDTIVKFRGSNDSTIYESDNEHLSLDSNVLHDVRYIAYSIMETPPAHQEGVQYYDDVNKTFTIYNNESGVSFQVCQEDVMRVKNMSGSDILDGSVIFLDTVSGQIPTIGLASARNEDSSDVIAVATHTIETGTFGWGATGGKVRGLNLTGFTPSGKIFLSESPGLFTETVPTPPSKRVGIGNILDADASGAVQIHIQHNVMLDYLSDVLISGPTFTDILLYTGTVWIDTTLSADLIKLDTLDNPLYTTVQDDKNIYNSAGWVSGGVLSAGTADSINVTAGQGAIRATDSDVANLFNIAWTESLGVQIPDDSTVRYIGIEYNAGVPRVFMTTSLEDMDDNTKWELGSVINEGNAFHWGHTPHVVGNSIGKMADRTEEVQGIQRSKEAGGLILGETGTRQITVSSGILWSGLTKFPIPALNTVAPDDFHRYYRDGNGTGGHAEQAGQTQWDNTQYDDGTGLLATMTNNRWANQWWWLSPDTTLLCMYGTDEYLTMAAAQEENVPSDVPDAIGKQAFLIAQLTFQESASTSTIVTRFGETGGGSAVTSHDQLSNITPTDHHTATVSGDIDHGSTTGLPDEADHPYAVTDQNLTDSLDNYMDSARVEVKLTNYLALIDTNLYTLTTLLSVDTLIGDSLLKYIDSNFINVDGYVRLSDATGKTIEVLLDSVIQAQIGNALVTNLVVFGDGHIFGHLNEVDWGYNYDLENAYAKIVVGWDSLNPGWPTLGKPSDTYYDTVFGSPPGVWKDSINVVHVGLLHLPGGINGQPTRTVALYSPLPNAELENTHLAVSYNNGSTFEWFVDSTGDTISLPLFTKQVYANGDHLSDPFIHPRHDGLLGGGHRMTFDAPGGTGVIRFAADPLNIGSWNGQNVGAGAKWYWDGDVAFDDTTDCTGACDSSHLAVEIFWDGGVGFRDTTDCTGACDSVDSDWLIHPDSGYFALSPSVQQDTSSSYNMWAVEKDRGDDTLLIIHYDADSVTGGSIPDDTVFTAMMLWESMHIDSQFFPVVTGIQIRLVDSSTGTLYKEFEGYVNVELPDSATTSLWHSTVSRHGDEYLLQAVVSKVSSPAGGDSTAVYWLTSHDDGKTFTNPRLIFAPSQVDGDLHEDVTYRGDVIWLNDGDGYFARAVIPSNGTEWHPNRVDVYVDDTTTFVQVRTDTVSDTMTVLGDLIGVVSSGGGLLSLKAFDTTAGERIPYSRDSVESGTNIADHMMAEYFTESGTTFIDTAMWTYLTGTGNLTHFAFDSVYLMGPTLDTVGDTAYPAPDSVWYSADINEGTATSWRTFRLALSGIDVPDNYDGDLANLPVNLVLVTNGDATRYARIQRVSLICRKTVVVQ